MARWWAAAGTAPRDAASKAWWEDIAPIAFIDVGRVNTIDPSAGQEARVPLLGSGVGLRLDGRTSAAIDLAWPQKSTATQPSGRTRIHARVAMRF